MPTKSKPRVAVDSARFSVTLPRAIVTELKAIADECGQKLSAVMREAAYLYLRTFRRRKAS